MATLPVLIRVILAALLGLGTLWAQAPEPAGRMRWQEFGLDDGLQNLSVAAICQEGNGLIWVGTEEGLHRFDGKSFQGFRRKDGLPSSVIQVLLAHPAGTLWIGTYRGLARREGGRFVIVGAGQSALGGSITALAAGPGGGLCVGTAMGPYRQVAGDRFEPMPGWPGGAVGALAVLPGEGGLVASSWDGHRARVFRAEGAGWTELPGSPGFAREPLNALAVDGAGRLWARSMAALWSFRRGDFEPAPFRVKRADRGTSLHVDGRGRLWIPGTDELLWLDKDDVRRMGAKEGWSGGLGAAILLDRGGALWAGGRGLGRVKGRRFWRSYGIEEGLVNPSVWSLVRDRNGRLFAGTERGLARLDTGGWRLVPGTEDTQVRSVVQGPDGAFYLAGSAWVRRWDPATGQTAKFGAEQGVKADGRIFRLLFDRAGILWVATDSGGLLRGAGQGSQWTFRPEPLPGGTATESIGDLHLDAEGRLWAPGDKGVALREGGRWRRFTRQDGLREDAVDYTRPLRNGDLLLAYSNNLGVARVRYERGRLRILRHLDAEIDPSLTIFLLGEDVRGNLWVGSSAGVHLVHGDGTVEVFTYRDGLVSDATNNTAFLADPGGDVWIGTIGGIARFDARAYDGPPPAPVLETYACTLGTRAFEGVPAGPLEVPFRDNTFEARFAAMGIFHQDDLHLEIRLQGLEPEWHAAHGRVERYAGLGAGHYAFQVRSLGVYAAPIHFKVLPPWWGTWTFRALAVLGAVAAAFGYTQWRTWALSRRNALLEERVAGRTRQLTDAKATLEQRVQARTLELQAQVTAKERAHAELAEAQQRLIDLSHLAGRAQVAAGVLHNVGNVLNSVNVSTTLILERLRASEVAGLADLGALLRQHEGDLEGFLAQDGRGRDVAAFIMQLADQLRDENLLLQREQEHLGRNVDHIKGIISAQQRFATSPGCLEQVAVRDLVEDALRLNLSALLQNGIEVARAYGELPPVFLDRNKVLQILVNLVQNARQALEDAPRPDRRLSVAVAEGEGRRLEIAIQDNGVGIPPGNLTRIFSHGFSTRTDGHGFGLHISALWAREMGGQLQAQSDGEGQGATFTLVLPMELRLPEAESGP